MLPPPAATGTQTLPQLPPPPVAPGPSPPEKQPPLGPREGNLINPRNRKPSATVKTRMAAGLGVFTGACSPALPLSAPQNVVKFTPPMTVAVCIACGAEKFGAWVPCPVCGFEPTTVVDKAKSLMLSDQSVPPDELHRYSSLIKSSQQVPYEPVSLAYWADVIEEDEYFLVHLDHERGVLPCMRCGSVFKPKLEEIFCPACACETKEALCSCSKCVKIFERDAKYCQECGAMVVPKPDLSPTSIGRELAIAVRRIITTVDVLAKFETLSEMRRVLPSEKRVRTEVELEILGMYVSVLALRQVTPSLRLVEGIVKAMLDLYQKGWLLAGVASSAVGDRADLCLSRFQQYEDAWGVHENKRTFWLAEAATRHCLGIEKNLKAVTEMMLVINYLIQIFRHSLNSAISR